MLRTGHKISVALVTLLIFVAAPAGAADFETAMNNFKAGKYVDAAAQFQELVDQSPSYDYGYYMLGLSFIQMGKNDEAETNFKKALELNPDKFEYHHGLATACFKRKQYDRAIASLRTAEPLATDSGNKYRLYKLRGFSYVGLEKWADAINDLESARKIKSSAAVLNRLGQGYYSLGHYDKAVPVLREALKQAPDSAPDMNRLANSLINLGAEAKSDSQKAAYYKEGLEVADRYQRAKPGSYEAYNMVGRAALGAKDYGRAEKAFETVLEKKPDYCYAMVNLGKVHIATEQWAEAETVLQRAAKCAPRMAVIHESLGFAVQKQKRLPEAIEHYEVAMQIKPSSSTKTMLETAQENLRIQSENIAMDQEEAEMKAEEERAKADYDEQMAKQKEWEERRKRDE
jgi:tetratricopeptide (TPR) repeat protein